MKMLKTKEKIYIYNRNRIIYTKDNKSYFKYNRKYLLLNNDDDLYTNAESIVYKYIGGYIGEEGGVDIDSEEKKKEEEEKKKEEEEKKKKCQDFRKVFSKVIINKIKNIIKNKENYVLYINDIDKKVIEEEKKESDEQDKQDKKLGEKKCPHINSKIINIYFIDNLFKKYIVDIIIDDNNINNILDKIYPTDNETNDNEKTEKNNCLKKINNSIKNKKSFFDKFKDFWCKKKIENCENNNDIGNVDDYFKNEQLTKIKPEIIIEDSKKINFKEYLKLIVNYNLNVEIFNYYTFYKEIMNINEE
jgi:hypothetical protein